MVTWSSILGVLGMRLTTSSLYRNLRRELSNFAAWLNKKCLQTKRRHRRSGGGGRGGAVSTSVGVLERKKVWSTAWTLLLGERWKMGFDL